MQERQVRFARTILNGFEVFFAEFQNITLAAKTRFENADWHGLQESARRRIDLRTAAKCRLKIEGFWLRVADRRDLRLRVKLPAGFAVQCAITAQFGGKARPFCA